MSTEASQTSNGFASENLSRTCNCRKEQKEKRICCVGMCVLDIIHVCATYPVEDTDKRCLKGSMQRGGNASNISTVLRELGYGNVEFLGMMSTAMGFEFLPADCKRRGICYCHCPTVTQNPAFSSVILVENTDSRTIVHSNSNFPILKFEHFPTSPHIDWQEYRWVHFEARNPEETSKMQAEIYQYNSRISNPSDRVIVSVEFEKMFEENLNLAFGTNFVFLGKDLARHMGWQDPQTAVYGLREWMRKRELSDESPSRPSIICPWGAIGASCLDSNDNYAFSSAHKPEHLLDALGAGDTFCAATIYALASFDLSLKESVDFGNYCAGLKLAQYGYDGLGEKVEDYIYKNIALGKK